MEKAPKTIKGTVIPIIDKYGILRVTAPQHVMPAENSAETNIVIAIDVSGSMSGSPLIQAKEALVRFVNTISKHHVLITIIAFESSISTMQCNSDSFIKAINFIEDLQPLGGTNFTNVFQELIRVTKANPERNYFIAFFTDGYANESFEVLSPIMNRFRDTVLETRAMAAIHSLGFGSSHDSLLLSRIIGFGTKEGTFQYVPDSNAIGEAITKLTSLIDFSSFWCEIKLSEAKTVRANFQKDENTYTATISIEIDDPNQKFPVTYLLKIHSKKTLVIPIEVVKGVAPTDIVEMAENFTELVRRKLIEITSRMSQEKLSNAQLLEQKAVVDILRDKLSELMVLTLKKKDARKLAVAEKLKECREMFTEYFVAFNEAMTNGVISNVSLAKLNNIAYKGVIDSKVAREMAKRTAVGQKYMEDMEENIKAALKGMDMGKLKEEYKERVEDFGHCAITYQTWIEALEEGDCLCLTYDAERNLQDILDSSTVRIKSINVSVLTAEAFVSAAMFMAKSSNGISLAEFGSSGQSKSLAKVLPNEVVNGILPLYICKEHWLVAKLKMAPMNAWTDTHDILAISKHHPIRIPFLVLIKALDDSKTEHKRMQFQWVLDTCIALYNEPENKELIMEDHKETFDKYLEFPQYRTTEFVRSVPIFFTHFCMAMKYKDIKAENIDTLLKAVMEEMLRRSTKDVTNDRDELMNFVSAIMPLSLKKTAEELAVITVEKQRIASNTSPAAAFVQVLKEKGVSLDERYTPSSKMDLDKTLEELNDKAKEIISSFEVPIAIKEFAEETKSVVKIYNDTLNSNPDVISVLNLAKEFFGIDPKKYSTLEGLGLTANEQIAYLILQNSLQASNVKRKTSVNAGNYLSPFAPTETVIAALERVRKTVLKDSSDYIAGRRLKGKTTLNKTEDDAREFARTQNLYEAAGILMGLSTKSELQLFTAEMLKDNVPLLEEKLKMLFTWEYEGVRLVEDVAGYYKVLSAAFKSALKQHFMHISKPTWYEIGCEFKDKLDETYHRAGKNQTYGHPPFP